MLHWIVFSERKTGISKLHFHRHWRDIHAPMVHKCRRYVQDHILDKPESVPWDGIVNMWWDSEDDAIDFWKTDYREYCYRDEPSFARGPRGQRMTVEDHVLLEGPPISKRDILAKAVLTFRRKVGMELDEFHRYWREVHGSLVLELPRLRRYVQCQPEFLSVFKSYRSYQRGNRSSTESNIYGLIIKLC